MNNISFYPPTLRPGSWFPPSVYHMNLIGRFLINVLLENLDSVILQLGCSDPHGRFIRLLFSPSSYHITIFSFLLNFTYQVGLNTHHAVPRLLHAIVVSILCVQSFTSSRPSPPRSHQNDAFPSVFNNLVTHFSSRRAVNRFSRHFAPVLSGSSSTGWNIHTAHWYSGRSLRCQTSPAEHNAKTLHLSAKNSPVQAAEQSCWMARYLHSGIRYPLEDDPPDRTRVPRYQAPRDSPILEEKWM